VTTLDLSNNSLGDVGAQYFAEAIHNNQVTRDHLYSVIYNSSMQTLANLNLPNNNFGQQFALLIGSTIQNNQVTMPLLIFPFNTVWHLSILIDVDYIEFII
jgi:hypothetical protein